MVMAKPKTKTVKRSAKKPTSPKYGKKGLLVTGTIISVVGGGAIIYGSVQNQPASVPIEPKYTISAEVYAATKDSLAKLKTRADNYLPPTDYDSKSMPSWNDSDKNGCKSRDDILARDLINRKLKDGSRCTIASGELFDYYIGETILYDSSVSGGNMDIDHIIAKGDAWNSGGYNWDKVKWEEFTNDPDELIAVSASINRQKGDKHAGQWLPPNEPFQCKYVVYQVSIKFKYVLSVTDSEKTVMANTLQNNCVVEDGNKK
jgi:hypothetical protein